MLAIVDKPLIQYAVEEAVEAGIETLICGSRQGFIRATVDYALEHEELRDDLMSYFEIVKVLSRQ
jgi:UTP-glucose-1-phosphate uridylyltransferase